MSQLCTSIAIGRTSAVGHVRKEEKVFHLIVLIPCVLAVIVSLLLQQDGNGLRLFGIWWPVHCALYENFGIKCAMCGLTRSFCAMGAGELSAAMHFHLLGPAIFVFVCLQIPYRIFVLWTTREKMRVFRLVGVYLAIGLAGILLINWWVYLGGLFL